MLVVLSTVARAAWPLEDWVEHPVGLDPAAVSAIGVFDADGDRIADLAVAATGLDVVAVAHGTGGGAFLPFSALSGAAEQVVDLAVADLDGDGLDDVVAAGLSPAGLRWWQNLGDGAFEAAALVWPDQLGDASAVAVGDVDGDGDPDLVVAGFISDEVWLLRRSPDRWWAEPLVIDTGGRPTDLALADREGDGDLDVLVASTVVGGLRWLVSDAGGFTAVQVQEGSAPTWRAQAADLDGDRAPDVLAATVDGGVHVWTNLGDGAYGPSVQWVAGAGIGDLATTDLDADIDADLVVAGTLADRVEWVENLGGGAFSLARALSPFFDGAQALAVADLDRDGDRDVAVGSDGARAMGWLENALAVVDQDADGLSAAVEASLGTSDAAVDTDTGGRPDVDEVAAGADPLDPADDGTADADGDGLTDAEEALGSTDPARWDTDLDGLSDPTELGLGTDPANADTDGGGTDDGVELVSARDPLAPQDDWRQSQISAEGLVTAMCAEDVDSDGDRDAVLQVDDGRGGTLVEWVENLGAGVFGSRFEIHRGTLTLRPMACGDVDADGDPDLVLPKRNQLHLYDNVGATFVHSIALDAALKGTPTHLRLVDLDADGELDVVFAIANRVEGYVRQDDGTFERVFASYPGDDVLDIDLGDLDGDGLPDRLVTMDDDPREIGWYAGSDDAFTYVYTQATWHGAVGDVDLDGDDDLITAGMSGEVRIYESGDGGFDEHTPCCPTTESLRTLAAADLDRDLHDDVIRVNDPAISWLSGRTGGPGLMIVNGAHEDVVPADLDGDGDLDLLARGVEGGAVWLRNGLTEDTDLEGLADAYEEEIGTDPLRPDTDGDGYTDAGELRAGTDPLVPDAPHAPEVAEPPAEARGGCGCDTAAPPTWLALPGVVGLRRRRSRD